MIGYPQLGQPVVLLDELVPSRCLVIAEVHPGGEEHGDEGGCQSCDTRFILTLTREQQDKHRCGDGGKDDHAQDWKLHWSPQEKSTVMARLITSKIQAGQTPIHRIKTISGATTNTSRGLISER